MIYSLLKPILFSLDAELTHDISLGMLNRLHRLIPQIRVEKPVTVMGLDFPNPVGLAAGLDKNADYLPGLSKLGFGFIEVGTVTPKPQRGNPKPRLFRLPAHRSIINRMGFNNKGVDHLIKQIPSQLRPYILGVNIGKNLTTAVENALDDYRLAMQKVYLQADYITVNISSPNTPGLRDLQTEEALDSLLYGISQTRLELQDLHQVDRPIALKVAPDLDDTAIPGIADLLRKHKIDCLIANNTTLDRSQVAGHPLAHETGGLSGDVLAQQSRHVLSEFHRALQDEIPIISVGGISSAAEAKERFERGAKLIQIYSGLIYRGPGLVAETLNAI
jgi:dihydroorotate dehydrogenase